MPQPVSKNIKTDIKTKKRKPTTKKKHKEYGTSKLEERFAKEFLDKLGVEYIYQYKAESIGRYYDFAIFVKDNDITSMVIIELNGTYWHSDPRLYEGKELTPTQKRNMRVDKLKKQWADSHRIPIYYIWEKDVNENPQMVKKQLKEILKLETENYKIKENKRKRH